MNELEAGDRAPGGVYVALWHVAWPVLVYGLLQWLVGAVDTWMVGRLGKEALSAVGMSRQIIMFLMIVVMAVSTGTATMAAQAHGAGDRDLVNAVVRQAIWMGLGISAVMASLGYVWAGRVLGAMGAPKELVVLGEPYMQVYFLGISYMVMGFSITAAFRGVGDTKTPLLVSLVVNVINVPANYVLIFGLWKVPAFGVCGAALGTLVARFVGMMIILCILLSGRAQVGLALGRRPWLDLGVTWRVLRVGLPSAGQGVARNGARMGLLWIVAHSAFRIPALAAYTVGMQFRMVSIMMGMAFQTAAASLVGQHIGADQYDEAEQTAWAAGKLSALPLAAMGALAFTFAGPLVAFFNDDAQVVRIGATLIRILAFGQVFTGISVALGGALSGAGDTKPGFVFTILGQWLLMLPLSWVLMREFGIDPAGVWIGLAVADVVQFGLYVWRLKSGAWRKIEV